MMLGNVSATQLHDQHRLNSVVKHRSRHRKKGGVLFIFFAPTFRNAEVNRKPTVAPHSDSPDATFNAYKELELQVNAILIINNHCPNSVSVVGLSLILPCYFISSLWIILNY